MPLLFLDTSFIAALEDADDQNHSSAISYWKKFKFEKLARCKK